MASDKTRVPRASIAVSILRERDYVALMQSGKSGHAALGVFFALVVAAKNCENGGVFDGPIGIAAGMAQVKPKNIHAAKQAIDAACKSVGLEPWLSVDTNRVVIRSFDKWNSGGWGGTRDGSGRKSSANQVESSLNQDGNQVESSLNQDGNQDESSCAPPQVGNGKGNGKGDGKALQPDGFSRFWQAWPVHFRKSKKAICLEIWRKSRLEPLSETIIAGLSRWKLSEAWAKDDGAFIPLPSSWLNQKLWDGVEDLVLAKRSAWESADELEVKHGV